METWKEWREKHPEVFIEYPTTEEIESTDYTSEVEVIYPKDNEVETLKSGDLVVFKNKCYDYYPGTRATVLEKSETSNAYSLEVEDGSHIAWVYRDFLKLIASLKWK